MDRIKLLGVPFDFGQDHIGVRLAFDNLVENGMIIDLAKLAPLENLGNLRLPFKLSDHIGRGIKHKRSCGAVNQIINDRIASMDLTSSFLLNVGGDHGLAAGTVHGILSHNPETVVVWADAHGDINIPGSSPSGNFHGMPLAFLLGLTKDKDFAWMTKKLIPKNLIFFGPRDLDSWEEDIIDILGIHYFSSEEINRTGAQEIVEMTLNRVDPYGEKPIHLSFDVDLFDSSDIKATGTLVKAGPRLEEVFLMGGLLADTGRLRSMDLVEFNPLIGTDEDVEASAEIIIKFLHNTLGQVFAHHKGVELCEHINDFSIYEDVV